LNVTSPCEHCTHRHLPTRRSSYLAAPQSVHRCDSGASHRQVSPPKHSAVPGLSADISDKSSLDQAAPRPATATAPRVPQSTPAEDRKSTRMNSSHLVISYAVF